MKLKYNSKNVDRSKQGDWEPPVAGVYVMKIDEVTYEKADKNHEERIVFVVRIAQEGSSKNYGFWDYVNLSVDWKIDQYLQAALGIDTESKPAGEFDPMTMKGKLVRGRVKSDTYEGEYRPKLASVFPLKGDEDLDEEEEDEDEIDEDEVDEEEEDDEEVEEVEFDVDAAREMAAKADAKPNTASGKAAIAALENLAEAHELDPDEFDTWDALVDELETLNSGDEDEEDEEEVDEEDEEEDEDEADEEEEEEEDEPAPKKSAKATKKSGTKRKQNYEEMEVDDLRAELTKRELPAKGTRTAMIARLRKHDEDPFADD